MTAVHYAGWLSVSYKLKSPVIIEHFLSIYMKGEEHNNQARSYTPPYVART